MRSKASIRRFDVFAEYNRQKAKQEGMPADQTKGYGLWPPKWSRRDDLGLADPPPRNPCVKKGNQQRKMAATRW